MMEQLRAFCLCVFLLAGSMASASPASPPAAGKETAVSFLTVEEDGGKISVSGTPTADGVLTRSFRLSTTRPTPLTLTFQPGDLKRRDGAIIDRRLVRVKEPAALSAGSQDYLVEISGMKRSGVFTGIIRVRSPAVPKGFQDIALVVNAERAIPLAIAAQTPAFALKRATSCDLMMPLLIFGSLCQDQYQVALSGPAETLKIASPSLLLVRSDGSAVTAGAGGTWVARTTEGIVMTIPPGSLAPGHYVGRTRVSFGDLGDDLDIPVTIDVRWKPWWPLLALVGGILLGRWQAYMQRAGNSLIESADRLSAIRARSGALPDTLDAGRKAVDALAAEIWRRIEMGEAEPAAAKTAQLERCVDVLERVAALAPPQLDAAMTKEVDAIIVATNGLDPDTAVKSLAAFKALLTAGGGGGAGLRMVSATGFQDFGQKLWSFGVLIVSRPALYLALLLFLAGAGMKLLYLDGGATLGAEPLADILALVTWGLSADVMSRTISTAGSAAVKK